MVKNVPDFLILLRFLAIPVFMFFFNLGNPVMAGCVFVAASITDFFDGFIARKQGIVNDYGKLMDPLADKILTSAAFVLLAVDGAIPAWAVVVIIAREFLVTGVRCLAAEDGNIIAAGWSGKVKTALQMVAIIFLLFNDWPLSLIGLPIGIILFYLATAATIYSGFEYCYKNKKYFQH
jgi:CDP-diacylglycerol--glycerol-3-phosphate 3-phosphatidyltransferase